MTSDKQAARVGVVLLVFAASFLYLLSFRRYAGVEPDEGIILQGAQRILQGQALYRDFFSFFTPGSYYLLALLFEVFGSSLLVVRTALAVYGGLLSAFTYLLARRVCSRWSAVLAASLVPIASLPWRFLALHNWDSTLGACAAVYCAVRWMETLTPKKPAPAVILSEAKDLSPSPSTHGETLREVYHEPLRFAQSDSKESESAQNDSGRAWALATGSFASLTILFEQSKGAGLVLGLTLGLAMLFLPGPRSLRLSRAGWLALGLGLAWPFAVTLAYFAAQHALPQMLADWLWPLHHYSRANAVAYGYQNWSDQARQTMFGHGFARSALSGLVVTPGLVLPVLPLIALGLLVYLSTAQGRRRLTPDRWRYYALVCAIICGLWLSVVVSRADVLHFVYLSPLLYLVLAWAFDSKEFRLSYPLRMALGWPLLLCFACLGLAFLLGVRGAHYKLETRRGLIQTPKADEVLEYTQGHVAAGSSVFVYPYLPLYYYLTATYSPTRYEYLQPGMHTREQDEEAIREIEADRTPVALFEPDFNEKIANSWPNTPIQYVANDPVGDYLLRHYRSCKVLKSASGWPFLFMVRKGLACPKGQ